MKTKNVEGGRAIGMAAGMVLFILMLAGGAVFNVYEIASNNMISNHRDRRQDWW